MNWLNGLLSFRNQRIGFKKIEVDRSLMNEAMMDVGFISEEGCGIEKACEELVKGDYRFSIWHPFSAIKYFKMAWDIDGKCLCGFLMSIRLVWA